MEKQNNAVGRRKEAVARVYMSKGTGSITVNGKEYKAYLKKLTQKIGFFQKKYVPYLIYSIATSFNYQSDSSPPTPRRGTKKLFFVMTYGLLNQEKGFFD